MINKVEICGVNTSKLPLLSKKEKEELFLKIKEGDEEARNKFINGNLRLVLSVIQRFGGRGESSDDLFQVGCIRINKSNRQLRYKFKCSIFNICSANDYRRSKKISKR